MSEWTAFKFWWIVNDLAVTLVWFCWGALIIGLLLLGWRERRRASSSSASATEPTCATCGYVVIGLAGAVCPECGSDLRQVGVRRWIDTQTRPALGMIVWAVILVVPAWYGWRALDRRLPVLVTERVRYALTGPESKRYHSIHVTFELHEWFRRPGLVRQTNYDRSEIRLTRHGGAEAIFRVVPGRGDAPPGDDAVDTARRVDDVTDERVLRWMETASIDTTDPLVAAEVAHVAEFVREVMMGSQRYLLRPGPFAGAGLANWSDSNGHPVWMPIGYVVLWVGLWLLGARQFALGRKQAYEQATAQPMTSQRVAHLSDSAPDIAGDSVNA